MVPYTRIHNLTWTTTAYNYYDDTDTSTTGGYCGYGDYDGTPTKEEKKIVIPKERLIFNRNKISNINIKLKQRILPVNKQTRFTTRSAL